VSGENTTCLKNNTNYKLIDLLDHQLTIINSWLPISLMLQGIGRKMQNNLNGRLENKKRK
jgi:hypothetical protein